MSERKLMYKLKQNEALSARAESTQKGVNLHPKDVTQTQQQRPESPTVTLTWHASKYKVHKLHQRTHNGKDLSHLWELSPGMRVHTRYINSIRIILLACRGQLLMEFMYLVFTCMPGESFYR